MPAETAQNTKNNMHCSRREWHTERGDAGDNDGDGDDDGLDALLGLIADDKEGGCHHGEGEGEGEGDDPEEGAVPVFVVGTSLYPTICTLNHSCDPNCK